MANRLMALRRLRSDTAASVSPPRAFDLAPVATERAPDAEDDPSALIERAKAGDRDAFGILYKSHYASIYRLARFYVESADEVASETFLRAWAALPRYRTKEGGFAAWLYGIAARVISDACVTQLRRDNDEGRHRADEGDETVPIATLVSRLPKEQRQVVEMKYLLALNDVEVAAYVNTSITAVNELHWQAISSLRMMEIDP
ncbi:MAG: RNA polymerase sigma factor [Actinomycetota bacterium]